MFKVALSFPHKQYFEYMRSFGYNVTDVDIQAYTEEESIEKFRGYHGIAAMAELFTPRVLDALKGDLKIIARHGIGYDHVDINYAAKLGICVCNTPGSNAGAVAETTLGLTLECLRRFYQRHNDIQQGIWTLGRVNRQIDELTIGLVGFGNTGKCFAKYLQGFDCNIIAYDPHFDEVALQKYHVEKVSLDALLERSDVVSLHAPLTAQTQHLVDAAFLHKMKPTAVLVNTARGGLVNEKDLIYALQNQIISGAGLDVFEEEPILPGNALLAMDNVFMTSHVAGQTTLAQKNGFDGIMKCFKEYLSGQVPEYCLNPDYVKNIAK